MFGAVYGVSAQCAVGLSGCARASDDVMAVPALIPYAHSPARYLLAMKAEPRRSGFPALRGAAWKKASEARRDDLSAAFDDPADPLWSVALN